MTEQSIQHPDEYIGVVVNDEATTLPPGARLSVIIDTSSWEDFEEKLSYLAAIELPGLGMLRVNKPLYSGDRVFVARMNINGSMFFQVKAPAEEQIIPAVDPAIARAQEVLDRVLDA